MREAVTMCGRFSLSVPVKDLLAIFGMDLTEVLEPRFNIAPTQSVAVVRQSPVTGKREMAWMKWGLIPAWAKDPR